MLFEDKIYINFVRDFKSILKKKIDEEEVSKLIFLCIGTDRVIGDCFGPVVGYNLKNLLKNKNNIEIIGDLENIVCRNNLISTISKINKYKEDSLLIAIDSAVASSKQIGNILVSNDKMNIGNSIHQKNIYLGDISIKGVVTKNTKNANYNFKLLQNVPLKEIMKMSECVSKGIYDVICA